MRKAVAILFALAILFSSGMAQFVMHICPEDGAMLSKTHCTMHEKKTVRDCCKTRISHVAQTKIVCCTEKYVFAISAKFGGITSFHPDGVHYFITKPIQVNKDNIFNGSLVSQIRICQHSPPESGREILTQSGILII